VDDELLARVRALLDREELAACVHAYARGLDRVDEELILSAFHPDAIFDNGTMRGSPRAFVDWLFPQQEDREVVQHYVTNSTFELEGETAHGETYFLAVIGWAGRTSLDLMGGRYLDRFERRDGRWRIALRVLVRDWHCTAEQAVASAFLDRGLHITTRDRRDVSYMRPLRSPGTS
jgi:hypothetical protein